MPDLIFNSFRRDVANGSIDLDTDTINCMLTTSAYTPSAAHSKRSDITNEVTGTGYTAGGKALTGKSMAVVGATAVWDADDIVWTGATITARYAVFYKSRGGASSADELIMAADLGSNITSTNGTFTVATPSGLLVAS